MKLSNSNRKERKTHLNEEEKNNKQINVRNKESEKGWNEKRKNTKVLATVKYFKTETHK